MATVDPTINDTMTRMQLRQIRQKLDQERTMRAGGASVTPRTPRDNINEQNVQLQQAMLRRQELLDKLRQEKSLREDLTHRPASYATHRPKVGEVEPLPRRAESQPPPVGYNAGSTPRQVVEHQFRPMRLDPMHQPPNVPAAVPAAVPTPYLVNVPGQPPAANTKAEMMEMMMLQNAQMHQMIMNQMMMQAIPKPSQEGSRSSSRIVDPEDIIGRRPAVHHHHYDSQPRPAQQPPQPYTLPPIQQAPPMMYPYQQSPRYYPAEIEPLRQPRVKHVKRKPEPVVRKPRPRTPVRKRVYGNLPFPGPWPLRRFRHVAYAVFFTKVLEKLIRRKRGRSIQPNRSLDPDFMFGIKLKEAVAALHAIYLNPANKVGSVFRQFASDSSRDIVENFNSSRGSEKKNAVDDVGYIIENVTYEMTATMPTTGVLGTHRKSVIVDMCRERKQYPKGYLWQIEKDSVTLDEIGRTRNVGDFEIFLFVLGIYLARGMVTTLLLKPVEYSLLTDAPHPKAQRNLKLMATVLIYIFRKMMVAPKQEPATMPYEISRYLYPDDEMKELFKKSKESIEYAENLIRNWGQEYVGRIKKVLAVAPID